MNKNRRKELKNIVDQLNDLKSSIDFVTDDERFAFDNLPESFQGSEKGEKIEENIDDLEEVIESIEECISTLEDIIYR